MAIIITNLGFDSFKSLLPVYIEALALRDLAESFGSILIKEFEVEQKQLLIKE